MGKDDLGRRTIFKLIPGNLNSTCAKIPLVLMFPTTINGFHELSPFTLTDDRFKKPEKHVKNCPNTKFVIFYGNAWDSLYWDHYRNPFRSVECVLKLFKMVYTTLYK